LADYPTDVVSGTVWPTPVGTLRPTMSGTIWPTLPGTLSSDY